MNEETKTRCVSIMLLTPPLEAPLQKDMVWQERRQSYQNHFGNPYSREHDEHNAYKSETRNLG